MTDAPERIWAEWSGGELDGVEAFGYTEPQAFTVEYIRADIAEAEKRTAYEYAAQDVEQWENEDNEPTISAIAASIRAIYDTGPIFEREKDVRATERERCANVVATWCNRHGLEMQGNRLVDLIRQGDTE